MEGTHSTVCECRECLAMRSATAGKASRSNDWLDAFRMSNAELADAITAAYNRAGTANEDQRIQQEHLKALLAVQLGRAQAVVADYSNTALSGANGGSAE